MLCCQAAQLAYVLDERLKETAEDAEREKALKDVAIATAKDKGKVAKTAEKRAQEYKKARVLAEKRLTKLDVKLGGTELKLAKAKSLNLAQADKIADLKVALEACEEKWYSNGFTNTENSVEPIGSTDLRKDGWLRCRPWECLTILH